MLVATTVEQNRSYTSRIAQTIALQHFKPVLCQLLILQQAANKAVVDIRLRPRCTIPPLALRPISRMDCAQKFSEYYLGLPSALDDPFCCMTLLAIGRSLLQRTPLRPLQRRLPMLLSGPDNPRRLPLPLGDLHPHFKSNLFATEADEQIRNRARNMWTGHKGSLKLH